MDFKSGGVLSESDLDTAYKQSLFVAQEVSEDAAGTGASGLQSVGEAALEAGAVTEEKIGANAVTSTRIADNAVVTAKIADDAVTAPKIADNAVITTTILNDAVTIDKIADDAVGLAQVADNAVGTAQIVNDAVTHDKVDTATKTEMEDENAAGVCVPDILKHHPGVAKCCGVVTYDGSTPTVSGGYNVASVSEPTGTRRRITFTNAMANANYVVHLMEDHWGDHHHPYIVTRATTYFDLDDSEGNDTGRKIHFTVFGTLA